MDQTNNFAKPRQGSKLVRIASYSINSYNDSTASFLIGHVLPEKHLKANNSSVTFKSNNAVHNTINYCKKHYRPSRYCMKRFIFGRLPILSWIFAYDVKESLLKDFIAGLTIGIINIPQGMAYSILCGLPAVYGLYVSLFPVIVYFFLGTSRHLSLGTFAITSLMTYSCIQKFEGKYFNSSSSALGVMNENISDGLNETLPATFLSNDTVEAKMMVTITLTFMTGLFQLLFAILHLGFISKFLSDVIVTGFTTGAAIHIVISQIYPILGISSRKIDIPFKVVGNMIEIGKNLEKINYPSVGLGVCSMILLIIVREFVNERYKAKLKMPVPIELIVVVISTSLTKILKLDEKYKIGIVGHVAGGIPQPRYPTFKLIPELAGDALGIAIVSFAINISIAKVFAKKYSYEIYPNQEACAYGVGNVFSSIFSGFPACVSLSRSAVLDSVGGKSQIFSFVSCGLILLVCLFLGPLFRTLPNTCLAAILIVTLKNMLLQITQLPKVFRQSKFEALTWILTFLGVIVFDVDIGLYIGVVTTLMLIIFRSQRPRITVLGNIPGTDIYESIESVNDDVDSKPKEIFNIKILRFEESVYYANVENFKYKIIKYSDTDLNEQIEQIDRALSKKRKELSKLKSQRRKKSVKNEEEQEKVKDLLFVSDEVEKIEALWKAKIEDIKRQCEIKFLILDCSCINNIDTQGVDALIQLNEKFKKIGVTMHLTHCKPCFQKMLQKLKFFDKFDWDSVSATTHQAVLRLLKHCEPSEELQVITDSNGSDTMFTESLNQNELREDQEGLLD